jgi:hypothetical protein
MDSEDLKDIAGDRKISQNRVKFEKEKNHRKAKNKDSADKTEFGKGRC